MTADRSDRETPFNQPAHQQNTLTWPAGGVAGWLGRRAAELESERRRRLILCMVSSLAIVGAGALAGYGLYLLAWPLHDSPAVRIGVLAAAVLLAVTVLGGVLVSWYLLTAPYQSRYRDLLVRPLLAELLPGARYAPNVQLGTNALQASRLLGDLTTRPALQLEGGDAVVRMDGASLDLALAFVAAKIPMSKAPSLRLFTGLLGFARADPALEGPVVLQSLLGLRGPDWPAMGTPRAHARNVATFALVLHEFGSEEFRKAYGVYAPPDAPPLKALTEARQRALLEMQARLPFPLHVTWGDGFLFAGIQLSSGWKWGGNPLGAPVLFPLGTARVQQLHAMIHTMATLRDRLDIAATNVRADWADDLAAFVAEYNV